MVSPWAAWSGITCEFPENRLLGEGVCPGGGGQGARAALLAACSA